MTYLPGFMYAIFVSFAHLDNQRFGASRPPWVTCFVRELDKSIRMLLGTRTDLTIFFDGHGSLEAGRPFAHELARSAGSSAVFLAITSPAYVNEDSWALDELRAFKDAGREGQRIFPIELLPLDDERDYPPAVRELARFKFWATNRDRVPVPIPPKSEAFHHKVWGLADQMQRHLKYMRDAHAGAR
jgi:hypothetical protein